MSKGDPVGDALAGALRERDELRGRLEVAESLAKAQEKALAAIRHGLQTEGVVSLAATVRRVLEGLEGR